MGGRGYGGGGEGDFRFLTRPQLQSLQNKVFEFRVLSLCLRSPVPHNKLKPYGAEALWFL